jgi:cephalosporin-C deacetylase-like acetyl esterase
VRWVRKELANGEILYKDLEKSYILTSLCYNSINMNRTDITFNSQDSRCAAWLYYPDGDGPYPCVILASGFGAIREMHLRAYAERFVHSGLAALVFDYRHFGASAGEPRQLLDIKQQLADWAAAVSYARMLDGIDPERIALWGTSFSGGHVIEVAARDHHIAAVVAQVPFVDGITTAFFQGFRHILQSLAAGVRDELRHLRGLSPYYIKTVGAPGTLAAITSPGAAKSYYSAVPADLQWENSVAARVLLHTAFYRPFKAAPRVQCPLLICTCAYDLLTPPKPAILASQLAPQGELRSYKGEHFDMYTGEIFEQAVSDQCRFLTRHLLEIKSPLLP